MSKWIDISEILNSFKPSFAEAVITSSYQTYNANEMVRSGLTLDNCLPERCENLPITTAWQNAILGIRLHESNDTMAQLYFSHTRDMFFRSDLSKDFRKIVDSSNINSFIKQYLEEIGYKPT